MEQILFCVSHVYSQLRYRWPGIPELSEENRSEMLPLLPEDGSDLLRLTFGDWVECINLLVRKWTGDPGWLKKWTLDSDRSGQLLAANIFKHLQLVREHGGSYVTFNQDVYPSLLKFIPDPPLAITIRGNLQSLSRTCVSVIGSRKASAFALEESYRLAIRLSESGFQVVSGGALGCDIAAHLGALASNISPVPTICVSAGGLAKLYPVHNQLVFDRMHRLGGVFLSERLWWEGCRPRDFSARNRIISGLSGATCVMQAAIKSGALLTARHSLNHGREVLVLRHPEFDVRADGSRWLQSDGAVVFSSAEELCLSLTRQLNII